MVEIRSIIGNRSIFVSIDETTDIAGRLVCNVIVGPLRHGGRGYFLTSEVIQKVNASETAKLYDNALKLLWLEDVKRDKVLIFVTDAAPYMKKVQLGFSYFIHEGFILHVLLTKFTWYVKNCEANMQKLIPFVNFLST